MIVTLPLVRAVRVTCLPVDELSCAVDVLLSSQAICDSSTTRGLPFSATEAVKTTVSSGDIVVLEASTVILIVFGATAAKHRLMRLIG